jgi:predicted nucleic acid-binding Zn ribbon protein
MPLDRAGQPEASILVSRSGPRELGASLRAMRERVAPPTLLAAVQSVWAEVVGEAIAAQASPVAERDGVVRVSCASAVWAQELELLAPELAARLAARLERPPAALRFTADAARHEAPGGGFRAR